MMMMSECISIHLKLIFECVFDVLMEFSSLLVIRMQNCRKWFNNQYNEMCNDLGCKINLICALTITMFIVAEQRLFP